MALTRRISAIRPSFMIPLGLSPDRDVIGPDTFAFHLRTTGSQTPYASGSTEVPAGDTDWMASGQHENGEILPLSPWIIGTRLRVLEINWQIRYVLTIGATKNYFLSLWTGTSALTRIWRSAAITLTDPVTTATWYKGATEYPNLLLTPGTFVTPIARAETSASDSTYSSTGTKRRFSISALMTCEFVD